VAKHDGGAVAQVVHQLLQLGSDPLRPRFGLGPVVVLVGELEQVVAFVVSKAQRNRQRVQDGRRGAGQTALFQARVVVRADHGELRHLLTAKPGNAPRVPGAVQADGGRVEIGASGLQEGAQLLGTVNATAHGPILSQAG